MTSISNQYSCQRIYVAHHDRDAIEVVCGMLGQLGHVVELKTQLGAELISTALREPADVMIVSTKLSDRDGIDALIQIGEVRPRPAIVLSPSDQIDDVERAMKDHVMSYLVEPPAIHDLQPAIYLAMRRFEHLESLHEQLQSLQKRLADRRTIEKAKGKLMLQLGIQEEQAHRKLQEMARNKRQKIAVMAESILDDNKMNSAPPSDGT